MDPPRRSVGSCLDAPMFERKDVSTDKYGEDSKLIFDLMDQGGEQLALRYDHTVPLARYLAMSGATWAKHDRRERCIGGITCHVQRADERVYAGEIVSLLCTILTRLGVGEFTVKINNRKILDGVFETCGVPS
ncbi:hypothetical protein OG21DRAFT_1514811 [Imleria badia]|nr:hypothetical protein OG21DRAFT_1514811 [Imleria badia]